MLVLAKILSIFCRQASHIVMSPSNICCMVWTCAKYLQRLRTQKLKSQRCARWQPVKANSHMPCRAHAVPLPCCVTKGLDCVVPT
jgi:hypothetical protein